HDLHGISLGCNAGAVDIDWPADFGRWLDRHDEEPDSGPQRARLVLAFTARALDQLRHLTDPPTGEEETATLRRVRQSRPPQLLRGSHRPPPPRSPQPVLWFSP